MVLNRYLIDTSAVVRIMTVKELNERWRREISSGRIAMCALTELEMRYSAMSEEHDRRIRKDLSGMFTWAPVLEPCSKRAVEVQNGLVANGEQHSAGPIDLLLAANAELNELIVLHDDKDFNCIARVTGQEVMRITEL